MVACRTRPCWWSAPPYFGRGRWWASHVLLSLLTQALLAHGFLPRPTHQDLPRPLKQSASTITVPFPASKSASGLSQGFRRSGLPGQFNTTDWVNVFRSQPHEHDYTITRIEGTLPLELSGTFFNLGPGLFERGGRLVKNWLDGDGLLTAITLDSGKARVKSRYIKTAEFLEEGRANEFLYRGQFGTLRRRPRQPRWQSMLPAWLQGMLDNAMVVDLKNPSNTRALLHGGKLLSCFEVSLPYELDPLSLDTRGLYTFDGMLQSGQPVTSDLESLRKTIKGGHAFSAHTRVDPVSGRLAGWSWRTVVHPGKPNGLEVTFSEFGEGMKLETSTTMRVADCPAPPHDFVITRDYYVWIQHPAKLDLLPVLLGLKGPGECLAPANGCPAVVHLVPRPSGRRAGQEPLAIELDKQCFLIHWSHGLQLDDDEEGGGKVVAYASGWGAEEMARAQATGNLFGKQVKHAPDFKSMPIIRLQRLELDVGRGRGRVDPVAPVKQCFTDFPKVHPGLEGSAAAASARTMWMVACNDRGMSSAPQGYVRLDLQTGEVRTWHAGDRKFVCEATLVPKAGRPAEEEESWTLCLVHDSEAGTSSLHVFDVQNMELQARVHLDHHVPWGIHCEFAKDHLLPEPLGGH